MPLEELRRHGHEVTLLSQRDDGTKYGSDGQPVTAKDFEGYDVIVGQRRTYYEGLGIWRHARNPFSRLVYENDDDPFTITRENWQAYQYFQRSDVREAIIAYCEASDLVTVTSEHLAGIHRKFSPRVAVLPNHIPEFVLSIPRTERKRPRIGWVGGASHARDIHLAVPSVRRFLQRFPEWDLYLGGTDYRASFKVAHDRAFFESWKAVAEDPQAFYQSLDFDIGICPLLDTDFSRSKSAIKSLEYAARGIPIVATDCLPYRQFVRHGENGFLAKRDHEWLKYLSDLASDDELRRKMGETAKADAAGWTIEKGWKKWEEAYSFLFPGGGK